MRHCVFCSPSQAKRVIVISEKIQEGKISNHDNIVSTLFVVVRVTRGNFNNSFSLLFDIIVNDVRHLSESHQGIGLSLSILNINENGMFIFFIDVNLEIPKEHI